jgi:hypothetical protein
LASADIVKFVVMSEMMSDGAADVCSVVHRGTLYKSEQPRAIVSHTIGARRRNLRHI